MEILSLITKFLLAPSIFILSLAGYTVPQTDDYVSLIQNAEMVEEQSLGTTIANTVAGFETSLASSLTDNDTQMTLVSFTTDDGTDLTVGKKYAFTIDEGSASREFVIGTASSSNRIVDMIRGVSVEDGATEISANKKAHRRGASVKITNFQLVTITNILNDTATIPSPIRYASDVATTSFSSDQHLTSKAYVDYVAFNGAGVIDANETARGVVELATQTEMASSTAIGSAGPLVLQAKYATSTGGNPGLWSVVTNGLGLVDESFILSTPTLPWTFSPTTITGHAQTEIVTFTSSGTWTKDAGLEYIIVEGVAGGGSGGGGNNSNANEESGGSGGGSGGYFKKKILASSLPSTVTVTVGTGGTGSVSFGNGVAGNSTVFTGFATSTGGGGGLSGTNFGGAGGTATGGDININGGEGGFGYGESKDNARSGYIPGMGATSFFGGQGAYGSGSRGGRDSNSSAGSNGIVIVTEYY